MSDFDGVEWLDVEQVSKRKELAPAGEHEVKIVAAEKYKSEAGNWTVKVSFEFSDGDYREHNEWYNLWAANADAKRISNEMFTHLAKAVGFKQFPGSIDSLVNKTLCLNIYHKDEENTKTGETVTRTKVGEYLNSKKNAAPSSKSKPPF